MDSKAALLVALASGAIVGIAEAGTVPDLPHSGKTHYSVTVTEAPLARLTWGDVGSSGVYELRGVTRNEDGQPTFDRMTTHCFYHVVLVGAGPQVQGSCSYMDADGDQMFSQFTRSEVDLLGGTGKYKGLHGKGDLKVVRFNGPDDLGGRLSDVEMTWEVGS